MLTFSYAEFGPILQGQPDLHNFCSEKGDKLLFEVVVM